MKNLINKARLCIGKDILSIKKYQIYTLTLPSTDCVTYGGIKSLLILVLVFVK